MPALVEILVLLFLVFVFVLGILAIIRGKKGIDAAKTFETGGKKVKFGYMALSIVHMAAGLCITISFIVTGILILASYLRGVE